MIRVAVAFASDRTLCRKTTARWLRLIDEHEDTARRIEPACGFGVCGAGTMGAGIAYAAAVAGYDVRLYDIGNEQLQRGDEQIVKFLKGGVDRGKMTQAEADIVRPRAGE